MHVIALPFSLFHSIETRARCGDAQEGGSFFAYSLVFLLQLV